MVQVSKFVADAVIGIDTLWGGDVMCASGTGRFIADSWFSDDPLPSAYTVPTAQKVRETGGVGGKKVDRAAVEAYLKEIDLPAAISGLKKEANKISGLRGSYLSGLHLCLETMWDLAMEILGKGEPVPYAKCVEASTGKKPEASKPEKKRARVAELLARAGHPSSDSAGLLGAVDAWRRDRCAPMASVRALSTAVIAHFDQLSVERPNWNPFQACIADDLAALFRPFRSRYSSSHDCSPCS